MHALRNVPTEMLAKAVKMLAMRCEDSKEQREALHASELYKKAMSGAERQKLREELIATFFQDQTKVIFIDRFLFACPLQATNGSFKGIPGVPGAGSYARSPVLWPLGVGADGKFELVRSPNFPFAGSAYSGKPEFDFFASHFTRRKDTMSR